MVAPAGLIAGSGSPEGVRIGNPGQRYRDLDTDDLYMKTSGTQEKGWQLIGKYGETGAVGAANSTIYSAVSPVDVISITGPALCIGTGAVNGQVWVKTTQGSSSADWYPLLT